MLTGLKALLFPNKNPQDLSREQVALLAQFKNAKTLKPSGINGAWEAVLNEDPEILLKKFVKNGLLVQASAEEHAYFLTLQELKAILKKSDLPVSGKKSAIVERVISSGYDVFKESPRGSYWKCSDEGLAFVTPYLAAEEQRKQDTIQRTRDALSQGNMKLAAQIAGEYHANGLFASVNQDLFPVLKAKDILNRLQAYELAKRKRPTPFSDVEKGIFDEAIDACMWSSLGLGKSENNKEAERIGLELWKWPTNLENLARFKQSEAQGIIEGIEILCGDECAVAATHKGKVYSVAQAPELPLRGCERQPCCACTYIARVKGFS